MKAVIFDVSSSSAANVYNVWRCELRPGRRYERAMSFGPFASRDEAYAFAKKATKDYKAQLPKKPIAPLRLVVSYEERGNYGVTIVALECGHTVTRKGGWYFTDPLHRRSEKRGKYTEGGTGILEQIPEGQHRARCEKCFKEGKLI